MKNGANMRKVGYVVVGYEFGVAYASAVIRHGVKPCGIAHEMFFVVFGLLLFTLLSSTERA